MISRISRYYLTIMIDVVNINYIRPGRTLGSLANAERGVKRRTVLSSPGEDSRNHE